MEQEKRHIEIMAPAGNFECLTAAAQAGAGAVYFGVGTLNMRAHAARNFTIPDLPEITRFCREHGMHSYLTLNTILYNKELEDARTLVKAAKEAGISAIIASDMAAIQLAREYGVEVHISTQLNISNIEALKFYAQFADVIVLARELSLTQMKEIAEQIKERHITGPSGNLVKLEIFCHGALCMAISGKCYLSLHEYNQSANKGSCLQLCRRAYEVKDLETGTQLQIDGPYIMSPKDLCTIKFLDKILDTGVEVLKIEGRARAPEYVKTVVEAYRQGVEAVQSGTFTEEVANNLEDRLSTVFNRGFWGGYYQGAKIGEWSKVYGSQATERKSYVAKITNYFPKISVAEVLPEAAPIHVGDKILIIGPTTGVIEHTITEIRVDLKPVEMASQGQICSIPIPERLRRSDKIFRVDKI